MLRPLTSQEILKLGLQSLSCPSSFKKRVESINLDKEFMYQDCGFQFKVLAANLRW